MTKVFEELRGKIKKRKDQLIKQQGANKLILLRTQIEKSWCRESSYKPEEWTPENPAWGQCAVTAKLLYELYGGFISHGIFLHTAGTVKEQRPHYWNDINGFEVDLTMCQFDITEVKMFKSYTILPIEDLVHNEWMKERYEIFKNNFFNLK